MRNLLAVNADLNVSTTTTLAGLGSSCAGGDLNADGYADLLVGAPHARPRSRVNAGEVNLLMSRTDFDPKASKHVTIKLNSSTPTWRFQGKTNSQLGSSVAMGDVNGDGRADILMAAPGASPKSRSGAGEIYLFLAPKKSGVENYSWKLYK